MKVAFTTLGCRTNQHDTAEMQTLLREDGFLLVSPGEEADIYVINTCTVTQRSDYNSRLAVKKSLGLNENALVVFTGCYAQNSPEEVEQISGLGLVLGNANKQEIVSAIKNALYEDLWSIRERPTFHMSDITQPWAFQPIPVDHFQGLTKAFIKVQTGCDEVCSFCTVTRARGRSISDSRENVLNNIRNAIAAGYREITLTGINLGTWGTDLDPPGKFSSLVEDVLRLKGDFRVRISSINPMEIDNRLIDLMADDGRLCPHFHIPLQSGDDSVLSKMRRNYNSKQYRDVVERAASKVCNLGLGADVIVGFPGETDTCFENSRTLIEQLPFSYLHVFSYSQRKGTEAAEFIDSVPKKVKKLRNRELTELGQAKSMSFRNRFRGQTVSVLTENERDPHTGWLKGHSEHFIPVIFQGDDDLINRIIPVGIQEVSGYQVTGCAQS